MSSLTAAITRKLPASTTPVVFAFYMSAIMAVLMCLIITGANQGVSAHYLEDAFNAYKIAMPSAFICVMAVRPLVGYLVQKTVQTKA
ncbi:DUF2798 domain-containing protein [Methylophaga thiooxydans]|uniref:DUF2798 domain-containing protein n=1 Tax=Methylophaga thiooxydans DMS010 TaxID=637616 RepID=C0N596_9GAMM|nr:DUF2798 domain-containing protein [Methylophaga thiooxydans]EEF79902.1 hypothetical protein MDMS009_1453 [Methylophaga thiooxydans DMS010]